ncbi:hypothetical protein Hanom_Chr03g00228731 [Helianthus anomalus]
MGEMCALNYCLAEWFVGAYHGQERLYMGGAYITQIALLLGLVCHEDPQITDEGTIEPTRLTQATLINMHIMYDLPGVGFHSRDREGHLFVPVDLSDELPAEEPIAAGDDAHDDDADPPVP